MSKSLDRTAWPLYQRIVYCHVFFRYQPDLTLSTRIFSCGFLLVVSWWTRCEKIAHLNFIKFLLQFLRNEKKNLLFPPDRKCPACIRTVIKYDSWFIHVVNEDIYNILQGGADMDCQYQTYILIYRLENTSPQSYRIMRDQTEDQHHKEFLHEIDRGWDHV